MEQIFKAEHIGGDWSGTVMQMVSNKKMEFGIVMTLQKDGDKVTGQARLTPSQKYFPHTKTRLANAVTLDIEGNLYKESFLHLNYRNPDQPLQAGYMVINLLDAAMQGNICTVEGLFIGYGPQTQKVVNGEIMLKKALTTDP